MICINELTPLKEKQSGFSAAFSSKRRGFYDRRMKVTHNRCSGTAQIIGVDKISLNELEVVLEEEKTLHFEVREDCVLLVFVFEGAFMASSTFFKQLCWTPGAHNAAVMPCGKGKVECKPGKYKVFYSTIPLPFFKSNFSEIPHSFQKFHDEMEQGNFSLLRKENGIINHRIYRIVEDIFHKECEEGVKKIFIKAKLFELLSIQLEQLCTVCSPVPPVKKEDAEKMYRVRDFILAHLNEYHSLKNLAKRAGTNEYTLKKEFKELFGTTVFEFWHEVKMEKAQKLIQENEKSIKQISEIIGYKNPQHFSTAFKKEFGMPPSVLRKNMTKNNIN